MMLIKLLPPSLLVLMVLVLVLLVLLVVVLVLLLLLPSSNHCYPLSLLKSHREAFSTVVAL